MCLHFAHILAHREAKSRRLYDRYPHCRTVSPTVDCFPPLLTKVLYVGGVERFCFIDEVVLYSLQMESLCQKNSRFHLRTGQSALAVIDHSIAEYLSITSSRKGIELEAPGLETAIEEAIVAIRSASAMSFPEAAIAST